VISLTGDDVAVDVLAAILCYEEEDERILKARFVLVACL
jgi:hypothetical protein